MQPLFMEYLENCFNRASELGIKYVGVKIKMDTGGFPKEEIIINPIDNFVSKLEYYKNTYDETLNHKFAKGVTISGFTFGDTFEEIEEDLIGGE